MNELNQKIKEILAYAIKNKDVKLLCKYYFKTDLTSGQEEIVRSIAFKEHKRIVISAYTRYGKSWAVAQGVLLYMRFNANKKVRLIAPTNDQATILRNYISEFILNSVEFISLLALDVSKEERLKYEVSKSRITLKNGTDLKILSAHGRAERLMGWGGDLIVLDESCLTPYEVYRQKISRMLGDYPDAMLVEIGNPWNRNNHMWEHWTDPKFKKIHIDWKQGLKEGRITKEFVEEQRKLLTDIEFTILYDAMFPEDSDDTLIKWSWIGDAIKREVPKHHPEPYIIYGLDVAEMGRDLTVLTRTEYYPDINFFNVTDIWHWGKKDTMQTVSLAIQKFKEADKSKFIINIDVIGVGRGVFDRLGELGYNVVPVKFGESSKSNKKRFMNMKAELYWKLHSYFEEGRIKIPENRNLIEELRKMTYEITTSGLIRIIDPEEKSPDFADSLTNCMSFRMPSLAAARIW